MEADYNQLKPAINVLEKLIKKFKNQHNIEIEIKLGRVDDNKFVPGIMSESFYNKIKKTLDDCKKWENVIQVNTVEYINKNLRKIDNKIYSKKRIENHVFTFNGTPYDFKISVSEENLIEDLNTIQHDLIRKKNRTSYIYKECKFDLTMVEEENDDEIIVNEEFEIELIKLNSKTQDNYRAFSALLKIKDVINMCENITKDAYLIKVS